MDREFDNEREEEKKREQGIVNSEWVGSLAVMVVDGDCDDNADDCHEDDNGYHNVLRLNYTAVSKVT